ncbi:hypothetical protein, partial [Photobacterium piscicola]|nr:hypothetical protein [Photobacterium piscicola]
KSLHPCHIKESLDSNVGAFLRLHYCSRLGVAVTGRAADSPYRKSARVVKFESLHPCYIQESLDSNVRIFYVCIIVVD